MDTYIIRIQRRPESDPHTVAGTVEEPGISKRKAFSNLDQLWDILRLKRKKMPKRTRILSGVLRNERR